MIFKTFGKPILRALQSRCLISFTESKQKNGEKTSDALIEREQEVSLMQDTYQKIKMQGLEDRSITGIDSFQKDILTQNKFDLLHPKIQPKIASLSTTMGLQLSSKDYLAQINLGKIKVKKENEVFLSEVDPYNIPEYYDIVFDYEKEMSLVGKKIDGSKEKQNIQSGQMNISTRKAFQQKSPQELMKEIFGVELSYVLNSRIVWKHFLIACAFCYFLYSPIIIVFVDYYICLSSISEIQEERLKHVENLKKESLINAIINNPDMNLQ